jgi:hypothetical protein
MHETSDHSFAADKELSHPVLNTSLASFLVFAPLARKGRCFFIFLKVKIVEYLSVTPPPVPVQNQACEPF